MIENWETKKEFYFDPPTDCSLLAEINQTENQTVVLKVAFFLIFFATIIILYDMEDHLLPCIAKRGTLTHKRLP